MDLTATGVQSPAPPQIEFVSGQQLAQMAYGDCPPALAVTALYNCSTRTIYLNEAWRLDDLHNHSVLVHELVHHVQESLQLPYPCMAAREGTAYRLQVKWLEEHGVGDPYRLLDINEFTIVLLSTCRDE